MGFPFQDGGVEAFEDLRQKVLRLHRRAASLFLVQTLFLVQGGDEKSHRLQVFKFIGLDEQGEFWAARGDRWIRSNSFRPRARKALLIHLLSNKDNLYRIFESILSHTKFPTTCGSTSDQF
jgi:hypothetical protein